tara:strand:+ start:399 stop:1208 length:810 start_codon:yes stop_codon:yes gene_type:complete
MGGHVMYKSLPHKKIARIDPFLLIDHINSPLKGGQKPYEVGVGPHPHRGFSPVTLVFKGNVEHRDSLGNRVIIDAGGTQWIHAGHGILHSERPSRELAMNGGENELIQIWINTPAQYKMENPYYKPLSEQQTPKIIGENSTLSVVAGHYEGITGPIQTYSPQTILRGEAEAGVRLVIPLPRNFNTLVYLLDGEIETDHKRAQGKDMIYFNNDEEALLLKVNRKSRFIVLSGEPIAEPIVSLGPFVMNTQTEIMQALKDSKAGKMGRMQV